MHATRALCCLLALATVASAQVVGIDDLDPVTGTVNAFPFNTTTGGNTSLHVYSVQALRARGLCAGAVLLDIAVAPASGTAGTYNAPQALLQIGHLSVSPPVPGAWTTHLASPITIHGISSGPYSFPWALNTHTSLPGTQTTGFVWDGVRDFGILYSSSPGVTGSFSIRRSATELRHYVTTFNATTQAPTSNGAFAMEVKLTWAAPAGCATRATYGTGCYEGGTSYYESFTGLQTFDFIGTPGNEQVIAHAAIGPAGFVVGSGASAWYAPTGSQVLNNAATPAAMADDSISQALALPFSFPFPGGSTAVVHAAANGYVILASTTSNAADTTPTSTELLTVQPRLAPLWCDLDPAVNLPVDPASGVYFDVDPSSQAVYITWLDCGDGRGATPAAGSTSISVQCVLRATGDVEYRYRSVVFNPSGAGAVVVGWSKANAGGFTFDPGAVDISAAIPFATTGPDRLALRLDSTFPQLGSSFTLTTSNVPNLVPLAIVFFGDSQLPGIDLGFIGAPNCRAYSNVNLTSATVPVAGGSGSAVIPIPVSPGLIGTSLTSQSVAFTTENPLGLVTSNGLAWTVGN